MNDSRMLRSWRTRSGRGVMVAVSVALPLTAGGLLGRGLWPWAAAALVLCVLWMLALVRLMLVALDGRDGRDGRPLPAWWRHWTTAGCVLMSFGAVTGLLAGRWLSAAVSIGLVCLLVTQKVRNRRGVR